MKIVVIEHNNSLFFNIFAALLCIGSSVFFSYMVLIPIFYGLLVSQASVVAWVGAVLSQLFVIIIVVAFFFLGLAVIKMSVLSWYHARQYRKALMSVPIEAKIVGVESYHSQSSSRARNARVSVDWILDIPGEMGRRKVRQYASVANAKFYEDNYNGEPLAINLYKEGSSYYLDEGYIDSVFRGQAMSETIQQKERRLRDA